MKHQFHREEGTPRWCCRRTGKTWATTCAMTRQTGVGFIALNVRKSKSSRINLVTFYFIFFSSSFLPSSLTNRIKKKKTRIVCSCDAELLPCAALSFDFFRQLRQKFCLAVLLRFARRWEALKKEEEGLCIVHKKNV